MTNDDELWWYNHKTGQVEKGRQSPSIHRDGPYPSRAEAERAPEIWRERSKAWESEENRDDD
jgi:hypothetical protein